MTAVNATVSFPVLLLNVDLNPASSVEEKQARLRSYALEVLVQNGIPEPIIHDCSDEDLIE